MVYQLLAVGYGFLTALAVMLLDTVSAGVIFLSLQCFSAVFFVPSYLAGKSSGDTWPKRLLEQFTRLSRPAGLVTVGTVAALLATFVTPVPPGQILLASLFALTFCIFLAGVCAAARALLGSRPAQALTLAAGLLMVSTPYYVNPFIRATSGAWRMRVVQAAVNINPLLVGAAGILSFDWLRHPDLYQNCLIGGWQFPFYYPCALKTGITFTIIGIILIAVSAVRRADSCEKSD